MGQQKHGTKAHFCPYSAFATCYRNAALLSVLLTALILSAPLLVTAAPLVADRRVVHSHHDQLILSHDFLHPSSSSSSFPSHSSHRAVQDRQGESRPPDNDNNNNNNNSTNSPDSSTTAQASPTPPDEKDPQSDSGRSLSGGAITGIVLGAVCGVALCAFLLGAAFCGGRKCVGFCVDCDDDDDDNAYQTFSEWRYDRKFFSFDTPRRSRLSSKRGSASHLRVSDSHRRLSRHVGATSPPDLDSPTVPTPPSTVYLAQNDRLAIAPRLSDEQLQPRPPQR